MKKLISFISILCIITITGCKKGESLSSAYDGTWTYTAAGGGSLEKIIIDNDDNSKFEKCERTYFGCINATCYNCSVYEEGTASIKDGYLHIGTFNSFKINQEPQNAAGGAYMILDDKSYYKEDGSTCYDGIKNQNETNIDCGGTCPACPTCNDGVKNQDETSIDCGGTNCDSCFTSFKYSIYDGFGGGQSYYAAKIVDCTFEQGMFKVIVDKDAYQGINLVIKKVSANSYQLNGSSYFRKGASNIYPYNSGQVTITKHDSINKKISGDFSLDGRNGSIYGFASGNFTNVKYR